MSDYQSAEIVKDDKGRQYHIGLTTDEISDRIIIVGDPDRAQRVAEYFTEVRVKKQNREFVTFTGKYKDFDLTVMSTGIGADNTEIAVIELCQLKFPLTIIRCGTCGALQKNIKLGDVIISSGAVRLENTTGFFVENGYPALSHHEVILSLLKSAKTNNVHYHLGVTATCPGFYGAQGRHVPGFPIKDETLLDRLVKQNVLNFEMEASALLTLATLRGFRAGCVCSVFALRQENKFIKPDDKLKAENNAIQTALGAFEVLNLMDNQKGKSSYWLP
jgi:uridine phosphorylase